MRSIKTVKLLLSVIIAFSSKSFSIDFQDLEQWQSSSLYKRGSIIAYGNDMHVSLIINRAKQPPNHRIWRKIKYNKYKKFRTRKLYLPGSVIEHDGKYYVSKRINVPWNINSLSKEALWLEFTHPAINYSLPEYDEDSEEFKSLIGTDSNENGIRDDYETTIIMSALPTSTKDYALSAGMIYGSLFSAGIGVNEVSTEQAETILKKLVLAKLCKKQLAIESQGITWSETDYFNTLDRVEAKFKLQAALSDLVDLNNLDIPEGSPCSLISQP